MAAEEIIQEVVEEGGGGLNEQSWQRKHAGLDDDKTKQKTGLGGFSPRLLIRKARIEEAIKEGGVLKDETVDSE